MKESAVQSLPKRRLVTVPTPLTPAPGSAQKREQGEGGCALCGAPRTTSQISFIHDRASQGERVEVDIRLCEACGDRLEKHLKRAIPKRLMSFSRIIEPPTV